MTKKELEKEIEYVKLKNEELKLNLYFAREIENETGFLLSEILKFCTELGNDSEITIKLKNILLTFVKKHKKLDQEKEIMLKELTDNTLENKI